MAARVQAAPQLLPPLARVEARLVAGPGPARWLLEQWRSLLTHALAGDPAALYDALEAPTEAATRLRQASPFAGVLSQGERVTLLADPDTRHPEIDWGPPVGKEIW